MLECTQVRITLACTKLSEISLVKVYCCVVWKQICVFAKSSSHSVMEKKTRTKQWTKQKNVEITNLAEIWDNEKQLLKGKLKQKKQSVVFKISEFQWKHFVCFITEYLENSDCTFPLYEYATNMLWILIKCCFNLTTSRRWKELLFQVQMRPLQLVLHLFQPLKNLPMKPPQILSSVRVFPHHKCLPRIHPFFP